MENGDLAEFVKNASQIMSFLPHYMWAENKNVSQIMIFLPHYMWAENKKRSVRFWCAPARQQNEKVFNVFLKCFLLKWDDINQNVSKQICRCWNSLDEKYPAGQRASCYNYVLII